MASPMYRDWFSSGDPPSPLSTSCRATMSGSTSRAASTMRSGRRQPSMPRQRWTLYVAMRRRTGLLLPLQEPPQPFVSPLEQRAPRPIAVAHGGAVGQVLGEVPLQPGRQLGIEYGQVDLVVDAEGPLVEVG